MKGTGTVGREELQKRRQGEERSALWNGTRWLAKNRSFEKIIVLHGSAI